MNIPEEKKEKIKTAADDLVALGVEEPTNDQVREHLGGGSLTHISPVMREWRESQKNIIKTTLEIPTELKKFIETSVSRVWAEANNQASLKIEAIRSEAESTIEVANNERDEALTEMAGLEKQIEELKASLSEKANEALGLQKEITTKSAEVINLTTENAIMNNKISMKDELIEDMKSHAKELRNNNTSLQDKLVEIASRNNDNKSA